MRIHKPGKVRDQLWFFGHDESGIYLLEGEKESMVISGGMSYILPAVFDQMEAFGIDRGAIGKILILHSHFDHVGVVPYLKREKPDIDIYASARAWEILSLQNSIATINDFGKTVSERMGTAEVCAAYDLEWRDDISGISVFEGDEIDLGGVKIQIFETPGHSSCSISPYVPEFKTLFPSDAGGIPYQQTIITSGNSDFTKYQQSLEKLKELDVAFYCADHYGYVTGDEAGEFITSSIQYAKEHRSKMEKVYLNTCDINQAAKEMVGLFYAENPEYFLSPEIFEGVYRQMIRHVAEALEGIG